MRRLALLAGLVGAGVAAAPASATTFCVPAFHAACPDNGVNVAQADLQVALTSNGNDGATDRIVLDAGTMTTPTQFSTSGGHTDDLVVEGAGRDASVITSSASVNGKVLDVAPGRHLTMRDLAVRAPASLPDGLAGAMAAGEVLLEDVDIETANPGSSGINQIGGGVLRRVRFLADPGLSFAEALATSSGATPVLLEDVEVDGAWTGLKLSGAGRNAAVRRARVRRVDDCAIGSYNGATTVVENAIVTLASTSSSGVCASSTTAAATALTVRHATLLGPGAGSAVGVEATAGAAAAGDATATVSDSIVRGFARTTRRSAVADPTKGDALVTLRTSLRDGGADDAVGDGSTTQTGNLTDAPVFAGPEDFRLVPGSPGIDDGDPLDAGLPSTDFAGAPRPTDGDGDGIARRDTGAFEYQPPLVAQPPDDGDDPPPPAPSNPAPPPVVLPPSPPALVVQGARDTRPPTVSRLRFGGRVTARRGGTVSLTLSEPASVQITFRPGGKRAVTLRVRGRAGANRFRIGKRKLHARTHQVTVVATDAAGNRSKAVRTRLRVGR